MRKPQLLTQMGGPIVPPPAEIIPNDVIFRRHIDFSTAAWRGGPGGSIGNDPRLSQEAISSVFLETCLWLVLAHTAEPLYRDWD